MRRAQTKREKQSLVDAKMMLQEVQQKAKEEQELHRREKEAQHEHE